MARISESLDRWSFVAGEPLILAIRWRDKDSEDTLDYSGRRFALVFYLASGRGEFATIDGVAAMDASGPFFRFVRDGAFTESLRGQRVRVDLVERLLNGHDPIATGTVEVKALAGGIVSYGDMIGRVETRFTIFVDDNGVVAMPARQSQVRYQPDGEPPYFSTLPSIGSDGTPQVGEPLTGVNGVVVNGTVTGRQWLLDGVAITGATENAFTPTATGLHTFRVTALGTDGTTVSSGSDIVVQAATEAPTIANTPGTSTLPASQVSGFTAPANALDTRLVALGV